MYEVYSHSLAPGGGLIVPLKSHHVCADYLGEGVDDVGAQVRVHVLRYKLALGVAVLRPVRVVAHAAV